MEEYAEIGVGEDRLKNVVVELVEEAGLVADMMMMMMMNTCIAQVSMLCQHAQCAARGENNRKIRSGKDKKQKVP